MDINKHIIDRRIRKIVSDYPDAFQQIDGENNKLSRAFVCLSISAFLDVELEEAFGFVMDGPGDAGIDAIYIGDVNGYDFSVTIFQGKYTFDLDKHSSFPPTSIQRVIGGIGAIFDPKKPVEMNEDLKPKVEEIRSLIADGYIPNITCVFTNNGSKWITEGDTLIKSSGFPENQVKFDYFNHKNIVETMQAKKGINETVQMSGKSIQEDFNFKRVLIGRINVVEIAKLFERHGDNLLDRNIRKYLGLEKNRVNAEIRKTLLSDRRDNFYFYNNGITMICSKFSYNALQADNWQVRVEKLQIINGGQSCKTILHTLQNNPEVDYANAYVLVRLYELTDDSDDSLITDVTIATNSQNPVDLRDLRANDSTQRNLETAISQLGYTYKRKKDNVSSSPDKTILSSVAAESVYSVWKNKPHLAKFKKRELFGNYYSDVFADTNGVQVVLAVLIYRYCDAQRKKTSLRNDFPHIPYSNYFIAMIMGKVLLKELNLITPDKLAHKEFDKAKDYFEQNKENLFNQANAILVSALKKLYPDGYENIDKRRLAATFRRGDLLEVM